MSPAYAVILVYSTSNALQIEKLLLKHNQDCKLIPVPRHLSSDCGVCVRILHEKMEEIQSLLHAQQVNHLGIEAI